MASLYHDFRWCGKNLVITDILYKIIAFVVLTPLAGILLRGLLAQVAAQRPDLRGPLGHLRRAAGFRRFPTAILAFLDEQSVGNLRTHREM